MPRIHVLDDSLINRIAAGEVVERPASVVKELVENSLDAGAGSITVRVEAGGRRSIRVDDDGAGMDRDDALLALERHATSKLQRLDDLERIATLGFRGEALSSIAAVSEFTLATAVEDGAGTVVRVHGGRIRAVEEAGLPRGTSIEVRRLFFNVPARRKFLRAESTESSHIARWLTRYALANPGVRFELVHGTRTVVDAPSANDRAERIAQVYGSEFLERLLPFADDRPGLRIEGFAGRPADALARRDAQHLFVNGRAVQDRTLLHAVHAAYGNTTIPGRYPAVFLFLDIDPTAVDVNVHPQKTEVRFRRGSAVHDAVEEALAAALSHARVVPTYDDLRSGTAGADPDARLGTGGRIAEATRGYLDRTAGGAPRGVGAAAEPRLRFGRAPASDASPGGGTAFTSPPRAERPAPEGPGTGGPAPAPPAAEGAGEAPEHGIVPLAQYRNSMIVAQDADGLVLIDQHAAHERVLFERFLAEAEANRVEVQRLLFPATFDLPPHEMLLLEEEREEFRRLGFAVEPFGQSTIRLETVPALAARLDPERVLRDLVGEAARARSTASQVGELRRRLVTTAACKAAVKFNDPLNAGSMQALIDDLFRCDSPSTCPHGRPVLFRLTDRELERAFGRH